MNARSNFSSASSLVTSFAFSTKRFDCALSSGFDFGLAMGAVREEQSVSDTVDAAAQNNPLVTAAYEGLKWELARDQMPAGALPVGGTKNPLFIYQQAGFPSVGVPAIEILHTFDENNIEVVSLRFI